MATKSLWKVTIFQLFCNKSFLEDSSLILIFLSLLKRLKLIQHAVQVCMIISECFFSFCDLFFYKEWNWLLSTKIWFINRVDNVNWPPYRDWKADVSSVSPSSERIERSFPSSEHQSQSIQSVEGLMLETSAFQFLYGGQFTLSTPLINQIIFRVSLPHWRSTTVSSETNPLDFSAIWQPKIVPGDPFYTAEDHKMTYITLKETITYLISFV